MSFSDTSADTVGYGEGALTKLFRLFSYQRKLETANAEIFMNFVNDSCYSGGVMSFDTGDYPKTESKDMKQRKEIMEKYDLIQREPSSNEVFVDIDTIEQLTAFKTRIEILRDKMKFQILFTISKSKHLHFYVKFENKRLSEHERVSWAAYLGSDPGFILNSMIRIDERISNPMVLFERKNASYFNYDDIHFKSRDIIDNVFEPETTGRKIEV